MASTSYGLRLKRAIGRKPPQTSRQIQPHPYNSEWEDEHKLAQRMTDNFCAGVCPSSAHKWRKLSLGNIGEDVRVMTRQSVDDPEEPPGVVLSAATSVWLPVPPRRLFDFLRDERLRSEWGILSNGGAVLEMAHIAKGQDHGNAVSLLRASAVKMEAATPSFGHWWHWSMLSMHFLLS